MHELALKAFEEEGFLAPEDFSGSGTVVTQRGELNVVFCHTFVGRGTLFLPESNRERELLMEQIFPGFE